MKALVFNLAQQFSLVLVSFSSPAVSFHRPAPKPLPFRAVALNSHLEKRFTAPVQTKLEGLEGLVEGLEGPEGPEGLEG